MKQWSARSAILCAVAFAALMVFGVSVASAFEGTGAGGWYWQNPLVQGNSLNDVAVTASHEYAVGDAGVIFRSDDRGATWVRLKSGVRGKLVAVDFVGDTTGWAVGNSGVIKTTNGASWTVQDLPGVGTYRFTSVSFADASNGWACGSYTVDGSTTSCRILKTTNGGSTWTVAKQWTSTSGGSRAPVQFLLQVDFVSATQGFATGWGYDAGASSWGYAFLTTTDGGSTWTVTRFGDGSAAITALDFTSATDGWLASASLAQYAPATIWKTTDGGATWVAQKTKDGATVTDLAASSGGQCYATGQTQSLADWAGFILHSGDGGATWTEEYAQDSVKPQAVGFSGSTAEAVGAGALFLSRNAATGNWSQYAPGVRKNLTNVQFLNSSLGWAIGWKSTILRTTDGGRTWAAAASVPSGISLEGIDMVTKSVGWAVGCSGPHVPYADLDAGYGAVVLYTSDGGQHWKFQVDRTTKPGLAGVDFVDAKHGIAVGTSGIVARTTNGGKTWSFRTVGSATLRDVKFAGTLNAVAVGGDTGTVASTGSIWKTNDGGLKWTAASTSAAPSAPLRAIYAEYGSDGTAAAMSIAGDRGQTYASAGDVGSWTLADITPDVVLEDPPFYHFMDIGLTTIPADALVAPDDATGWILGEDGAIWTRNASTWQLPPTVSSFTPESGSEGTLVTVYGSGFAPDRPGDVGAIGWVHITDSGSGYTVAPTVVIAPPPVGTQATATATVGADGTITAITIVNGGSGYSNGELYQVSISAPLAGTTATAVAVPQSTATVTFGGGIETVPVSQSDTQLTVAVPKDALTGTITVTTRLGSGTSLDRFVTGGLAATATHLLNHSGGSGQDNQLNGLAVVDWLNAWAVGDRGTILSFDRLAPETTITPSTGWVKTPQLTLATGDSKSGVAWVRWIVDPPNLNGDVHPPIGDWDSWAWQYGTTVTFPGTDAGYAPGSRHVIYYQALDNVGNVELDPFWLKQSGGSASYEVPKHLWVTLDTVGPQTYAPWPVTVAKGSRPAFDFWVNDNLSNKAKVTIAIKSASATVKTLDLGWLATSQEFSSPISDWNCTLAKGAYTFEVHAVDQAGNSEILPAGSNTFTVN